MPLRPECLSCAHCSRLCVCQDDLSAIGFGAVLVRNSERLVFSLKNRPGYVDGSCYADSDLRQVPDDTVFLSLENANITDVGLAQLPDLPRLRCLDLDSTKISDQALSSISRFASLEELWIEDTSITDHGLSVLSNLAHLRFVSITDCDISDAGIDRLRKEVPGIFVHF